MVPRPATLDNFLIPSVRAGYTRRQGLLVQRRSGCGGRRGAGAGALVRRAGPGRNPARSGFRRSRTARSACCALYSAISRGTEALIAAGRVPESEYQRMRAPFMAGSFPVPGEIRLRHGRRGRGRAGGADRPQRLRAASPSDQVRSAGRGRGAGARRHPAVARGARGQHRDCAQRDMGRRAGPLRTHRGRRRGRGRRAGRISLRADRRRRSDADRHRSGARGVGAGART